MILTKEQKHFIDEALNGKNILVDACIGSGKTSSIQALCERIPSDKSILYLTYNRLLKLDAQERIKAINCTVNNYHGFAWRALYHMGIKCSPNDCIQYFIAHRPAIKHYDILILDEYQDIDQEISDELEYIKECNPNIQLIAVGDMDQKIYDKTSLNVSAFIDQFLEKYIRMTFSVCFRLSAKYAAKLGYVWHKKIIGVNKDCVVRVMSLVKAGEYLSKQQPSDILCLGSNGQHSRGKLQNYLESHYSDKFNKKTVWSRINEREGGTTSPDKDTAIFTTFDGSKGMERPICVICDFDVSYWKLRAQKPQVQYTILRNIFLVAASRGKNKIIFVYSKSGALLTEQNLAKPFQTNTTYLRPMNISNMFEHKIKEQIEACYKLVNISPIDREDTSIIAAKLNDEKIDLSPCLGIYLEASFFKNYDPDVAINFEKQFSKSSINYEVADNDIQKKILYVTAIGTHQLRYVTQVNLPFVTTNTTEQMHKRLRSIFSGREEEQTQCQIKFSNKYSGECTLTVLGITDVIKNDIIWELKFVSRLKHEHILQLACYLVALHKKEGILWNVRTNEMLKITIPDQEKFLDAVAIAITKGQYQKYYKPMNEINNETVPTLNEVPKENIPDTNDPNILLSLIQKLVFPAM